MTNPVGTDPASDRAARACRFGTVRPAPLLPCIQASFQTADRGVCVEPFARLAARNALESGTVPPASSGRERR